MAQTYKITDGVRRAKAASLAGHQTIWARVGQSQREEKIPIRSLRSPKKEIDVRQASELERWLQVKHGMSQEPDLLPPIDVVPGSANADRRGSNRRLARLRSYPDQIAENPW